MIWTFVINNKFYSELKEQDEIKWNSPKDVRKGDIIAVYTSAPHSDIGFILQATSDPFEDPEILKIYKRPAVMIQKRLEIPDPITLSELNENVILRKWAPVKKSHFKFQGSHFKMSDEEWLELKRLIIEHNPQLEEKINFLSENIVEIDNIKEKRPKIWKITPGEGRGTRRSLETF